MTLKVGVVHVSLKLSKRLLLKCLEVSHVGGVDVVEMAVYLDLVYVQELWGYHGGVGSEPVVHVRWRTGQGVL